MNLTHDQIQERIDRTINNHQFTCQTVGYNIYILETPMNGFTLPISEWTTETKQYNQSYLIVDRLQLEDHVLEKFIGLHKYSVYNISFVDNNLIIQ